METCSLEVRIYNLTLPPTSLLLRPLSCWQDFHRVHLVNLSVWKETRLKHRWKHRLNFRRCYPPIVEGKHRWNTVGSPVKAQPQRLSQWNNGRNADWMSKVVFCFRSYTRCSLVSARSLPLQVGHCASRKHQFTGSILASMKRIFIGGSPFNSRVEFNGGSTVGSSVKGLLDLQNNHQVATCRLKW